MRRWVPELARLPDSAVHDPGTAPRAALAYAGVRLGETYPRPIVDHDAARERAIAVLAGRGRASQPPPPGPSYSLRRENETA